MPNYRRNRVPGGTYFFTVVTGGRKPLFADAKARRLLRDAIRRVRISHPLRVVAIVLLPDHLHTVWELPLGDSDYSLRWAKVKGYFTQRFVAIGGANSNLRRPNRKERDVWQPRFWEHTCLDAADVKRCVDYIHWNPVKHGLVRRASDYPFSSFHRFVQLGEYPLDWGAEDPCPGYETPEMG
jgi:putative transposase